MQLTSCFIANVTGASVSGADLTFASVVTDSRKPCDRGVFVALRGENFDGNDYVSNAVASGATGVIVSRDVEVPAHVAVFRVEDTLLALQALGRAQRDRFHGRVIGITGSNGKTTTKQMTASVMSAHFGADAVLSTEGSLNNHFGVPLTLLRLTDAHKVAVIEMGMNHFDEISLLTRIARPHVAVITNAGPAHLEGVGSLMGVAKAKGEIFEGLEQGGTAIINADDEYNAYWRVVARDFKQIEFGTSARSQTYSVSSSDAALRIGYRESGETFDVDLPLPGQHNQMNALAVASVARALSVPMSAVKVGLESARNVVGRLTAMSLPSGTRLFDDSYNANPASIRAAAEVLCSNSAPRYLVLGDMAELGDHAISLHRTLAQHLGGLPIDGIFTCGKKFAAVNEAFSGKARNFESHELLAASLLPLCTPSATVLVKGANSTQMWKVIGALEALMKEKR